MTSRDGHPKGVGSNQHRTRPGQTSRPPEPDLAPLGLSDDAYIQQPRSNLVKARGLLLDVVEALGPQVQSLVVIGAQAVYERTQGVVLDGVDPATADADFAVDPTLVLTAPQIATVMQDAGYVLYPDRPGVWKFDESGAGVDFLVPERFAGKGSRSARIPNQDKQAVGRAAGLELALFDRAEMTIASYAADDQRTATLQVAGIAALVCAKSFKLSERLADITRRPQRVRPKDATDVYRMLLTEPASAVAQTFVAAHETDRFRETAIEGRDRFVTTFGPDGGGRRLILDELGRASIDADAAEIVDDWVSSFARSTATFGN